MSALVPGGVPACGIYVLEFADGTEYVGQTVSLLARLQRTGAIGQASLSDCAQLCQARRSI